MEDPDGQGLPCHQERLGSRPGPAAPFGCRGGLEYLLAWVIMLLGFWSGAKPGALEMKG